MSQSVYLTIPAKVMLNLRDYRVTQQVYTLTIMVSQVGWVVVVEDSYVFSVVLEFTGRELCLAGVTVYVAVCIARAPLIKL